MATVACGASLLAAGAAGATAARTLKFFAPFESVDVVIGTVSTQMFTDKLVSASGKKLGSDTQLHRRRRDADVLATFKLRGGTIITTLAFRSGHDGSGSITGGTGSYATAKGTVAYSHADVGRTTNLR